MGPVLPTSADGSQLWNLDSSDTMMQASEYSEYGLQPNLGSLSAPSESLQTILDSPGNFDWVSRTLQLPNFRTERFLLNIDKRFIS
jgi:hypothetical protein